MPELLLMIILEGFCHDRGRQGVGWGDREMDYGDDRMVRLTVL